MHRRNCIAFVVLTALSLVAAACGESTQGPSTWLDRPLDGDKVPLEPLTIQAHASDADGVARFEFFVGDALLATIPGSGGRFNEAKAGWAPSTAGTYTVRARAIDGKGNIGPEAISRITVGELAQTPTTPTGTPTYTPTRTAEPTPPTPTGTAKPPTPTYTPTGTAKPPTPTFTPTPTGTPTMPPPPPPTEAPPPPSADIQFWADNDNIQAGSCTTVRWHVANVKAYWVDGNPGAGDNGSFQTCPCQEETHTLHVVGADGSEQDFPLTIHISGECAAPPPPPQDTEGPRIEDVGLRAQGTADTGCRAYGYSRVSDPSGVGWAQLHYSLDGEEWYSADMGDRGDGYYEAVIAGATGGGAIQFYVEASDTLGNTSRTETEYDYLPLCGPG
jgi:hypothetical protein